MRNAITAVICIFTFYHVSAQVNIGGDLEKGYRDFVQQTRSGIKSRELSDFATLGGKKRFFSNDWETGTLVTGYGLTVSNSYQFNYDFLDNQLYALHNDTVIAVN